MRHARSDYGRFQDPLGLIPDAEPVFILRGQDVVGWMAVKHYAYLAMKAGASPDLVRLVDEHAEAMKNWADVHGKTPNL